MWKGTLMSESDSSLSRDQVAGSRETLAKVAKSHAISAATERNGCAPHGLTATHQDQVNADLLAFIKS
jgi:hypothetical protein